MSWLPIGPDFVFTPRNQNFKRLSKRNEYGRQGLPSCIAVDQSAPTNIYDIERPSSGGSAAFRTLDGGNQWHQISDSLKQTDPLVDPMWIDVNPANPNLVYVATYNDRGFYISNDRGDTWGAKKPVPGKVRIFRIDPTTASDPANTHILAGAHNGVYYSDNSGDSWTKVADGECHWLAIHVPVTGTAHYYAGIKNVGLLYTTNPTDPWTNVHNLNIGLPLYIAANPAAGIENNFNNLRIDICARNPERVYVWLAKPNQTEGIYTSNDPLASWTQIVTVDPPNPGQGLYNFEFAVAPNSPGDGTNDILFIGSVSLFRSIDSGVNWVKAGVGFHADQQAFAFFPAVPTAGAIPVCYVGCDGGIGRSSKFCDPAFDFGAAIAYHNEGYQYLDTGSYENLNYAKQVSALYQYASHSDMNALSYIGCQDTGVNAGSKALGWRGIADADGGAMAVAPGTDSVKLWGRMGAYGGFPSFRIVLWSDKGEFSPASKFVKLNAADGVLVNGTSNYEIVPTNECLVGAYVRDKETDIPLAITADPAEQAVAPNDMTDIVVDRVLTIDQGLKDAGGNSLEETVIVTAVNAGTFSAVFTKDHAAGAKSLHNRAFASKIDQTGICRQISQEFGLSGSTTAPKVSLIISHFTDGDLIVCVTSDKKVWRTNSGTTATNATVWNEITVNKPAGGNIYAIAITPNSHIYVLYKSPVDGVDATGAPINTPLFEISTGNWIAQPCTGTPVSTGSNYYGKLVAHPTNSNVLFTSHRDSVYRLLLNATTGVWDFQNITENLPGEIVYDLWVGFHSLDKREENVILRAGIPTRGVWEKVFNEYGEDDGIKLYLRDHFLDQGLLNRSEDGLTNPYDPAGKLYHYKCADIKLDTRQPGAEGVAAFFQTDPEDGFPISHVSFDKLIDNSRNLPGSNQTLVHVQVRNRSTQTANNVYVWAVFCNASSGVPALSKSTSNGDNYNFWSQFKVTGEIIPALPADSPWTSVGSPVVLNGIDGFTPQIASWLWTTPALLNGDPGHYCMVVFIHSATNPIKETVFNVDYITPRNRQIGQKNLHVGEPLAEDGTGGVPGDGAPEPVMGEYLEFHNPEPEQRNTSLLFEFSRLPPELDITLQFTPMNTETHIADSLSGIRLARPASEDEKIKNIEPSFLIKLLCWIINFFCGVANYMFSILGLPALKCYCRSKRRLPVFIDTVYEVEIGNNVQLSNIRTQGNKFDATYIRIKNKGILPPGSRYSFDVLQLKDGKVVGGSEYIVRIAGNLKPFVFDQLPDVKEKNYPMHELHRLKREALSQRYLAPWIEHEKAKREEEMGKS